MGLAVACSSVPALAQSLFDSEWVPVEIDGATFDPSPETFIGFMQDGGFFGNAGCNTIRGSFVTNGDAILFGPGAMTMMACPGVVAEQETTFNRAISRARFFDREGSTLTMKDGGGVIIMRLTEKTGG